MSRAVPAIPGQIYGRLLVLEYPTRKDGKICALVRCECGNVLHLRACHVVRGRLVSCGCQAREGLLKRNKHGLTREPEYMIWALAKDRCTNPNNRRFRDYGGRGITMAPEWIHDFPAFYAHVGPRPSAKHSIERIDTEKGYEPGNCKWATAGEQNRNTRRNVLIQRNNRTYVLCDLAKAVGLPPNRVVCRRTRLRWPETRWFEPYTVEEAIEAFERQQDYQPM
jgi:hypothetical protein